MCDFAHFHLVFGCIQMRNRPGIPARSMTHPKDSSTILRIQRRRGKRLRNPLTPWLRFCPLVTLLAGSFLLNASAENAQVRHIQGTIHGYLELRDEDGHVVGSGDSTEVVRGEQVTARTTFSFKDGSVDDETTVFSQRRRFQLISDHHVQKGPFFPHPMDLTIDARSGQVVDRTTGKDGKEEVHTDHVDLPSDLANGIVPIVLENTPADTQETTVSMLVMTPKPRVVKLIMSPQGEEPFSVAGSAHKAMHYEIKIQIGGLAGLVAPMVGKAPPNIQIWVVGGQAPVFVKEQGPIYAEGPVMTIELASPTWPDSSKQGG